MTGLWRQEMESPLGRLQLSASVQGLCEIHFPSTRQRSEVTSSCAILENTKQQLARYFQGQLTRFRLPLDFCGTPFQNQVWQAVNQIPFGKLVSYADIARSIGRPRSARPVGGAVGKNPLPIVVPCHRVVGSDGALTGFTGGLDIKIWLLQWERARPD